MVHFMEQSIKKLPQSYSNRGLKFDLLDRNDKAAIYKSDAGTYEVFSVVVSKGGLARFGGTVETIILPHEMIPSDSKFGNGSYSFQSYDAAIESYNSLSK